MSAIQPPQTPAMARTVYRQAIERDNEHRTPATQAARTQAQDWLAALILPDRPVRRRTRPIRRTRCLP